MNTTINNDIAYTEFEGNEIPNFHDINNTASAADGEQYFLVSRSRVIPCIRHSRMWLQGIHLIRFCGLFELAVILSYSSVKLLRVSDYMYLLAQCDTVVAGVLDSERPTISFS